MVMEKLNLEPQSIWDPEIKPLRRQWQKRKSSMKKMKIVKNLM